MAREYYVRGEKRTVEELEDVLGVQLESSPEELESAAEEFGELATDASRAEEPDVPMSEDEREAFARAGWLFVRPSDSVSRSAEENEVPEGATSVGKVYRRSDDRVVVGTDRLTVQLQSDLSQDEAKAALEEAGLTIIRRLGFGDNLYEVRAPADRDQFDVSVELQENDDFVFAEPELIEHVPQRYQPSDPNYSLQWQWHNDGSNGGTPDADVNAETAWNRERGNGVRVSVIDNGFDLDHPDLSPAVGGGAAYFKNTSSGAELVVSTTNYPDSSHGTFCAGMAAARADNGQGGCGGAHVAEFMPVAALPDQVGSQTTLARAVAFAADPTTDPKGVAAGLTSADGADVISCSLGPNGADWELQSVLDVAIESAQNQGRGGRGTPVFWAVSNGNFPVSSDEVCSHPDTIAVGRSDRNDTEDGSAYGEELDFLAPGVNVYSTTSGGGYGTSTGTSFAAPCAASVGALVLGGDATLSADRVRQILRDTCDKIGGVNYGSDGRHERYGYGRVNAARAVERVSPPIVEKHPVIDEWVNKHPIIDEWKHPRLEEIIEKHPRLDDWEGKHPLDDDETVPAIDYYKGPRLDKQFEDEKPPGDEWFERPRPGEGWFERPRPRDRWRSPSGRGRGRTRSESDRRRRETASWQDSDSREERESDRGERRPFALETPHHYTGGGRREGSGQHETERRGEGRRGRGGGRRRSESGAGDGDRDIERLEREIQRQANELAFLNEEYRRLLGESRGGE